MKKSVTDYCESRLKIVQMFLYKWQYIIDIQWMRNELNILLLFYVLCKFIF